MENYQYRFEKLNVWIESRALVVMVYDILKKFPIEERFALCDQLRRAVISIPSNIAEGCGRVSIKEQIHFMEIAYGSLMETYTQLQIGVDLGYITDADNQPLKNKIGAVAKLLSGFRSSLVARQQSIPNSQ